MKQTISLQIIPSVLNFRLIIYLFALILDCYSIDEFFFLVGTQDAKYYFQNN
jgi:hypothetical protein